MRREVFDQDRPRSTMAQRLDEAFAGCEEWTPAPRRRRNTVPLTSLADERDRRLFNFEEERRAA